MVRGLESHATLQRDHYGIVSIEAASREDAALALGYAHAQDRFFQMDLSRRAAAGELGEVLGESAFELDRQRRVWRLRALARRQLAAASPEEQAVVRAYTQGVNAGLASLRVRPAEYLFLRKQPLAWREEDSLLTVHSMFFALTPPGAERHRQLAELKQRLRPELYAFLVDETGEWDSTLLDSQGAPDPPIPDPPAGVRASSGEVRARSPRNDSLIPGSNAWVVSGRKTATRRSMLAVDMHLPLSIPNTWYRAQLRFATPSGSRSAYGVTLPGFPGVVVGSNEHIAWGISNSQGLWADSLELAPCGSAVGNAYLLDGACVPFEIAEEIIRVDGAPDRTLRFRVSRFGPVEGGARAVVPQWLGARFEATNLHFLGIVDASTVDEALEVAARSGMPPVNVVVADGGGKIGWTLAGRLPVWPGGCDAPSEVADRAEAGWRTFLAPSHHPKLLGDNRDAIVTANQRTLRDGAVMCGGEFDIGARAQRIEKLLAEDASIDETDLWKIQLDTGAVFLERWQGLLLRLVEKASARDPLKYGVLRQTLSSWGHRATVESVGYRFVREFRDRVTVDVLDLLSSEVGMSGEELSRLLPHSEYPVWRLVSEQPPQWLPSGEQDWDSWLQRDVDRLLLAYQSADHGLAGATWGNRNVLDMRHPLFGDIPLLGRFFRGTPVALPGDVNMPRVQAPGFGASQRLVVSPGLEARGMLSMPGGQSANPLSPFFDRGHENWVRGSPQPLLAGAAEHTLLLRPH